MPAGLRPPQRSHPVADARELAGVSVDVDEGRHERGAGTERLERGLERRPVGDPLLLGRPRRDHQAPVAEPEQRGVAVQRVDPLRQRRRGGRLARDDGHQDDLEAGRHDLSRSHQPLDAIQDVTAGQRVGVHDEAVDARAHRTGDVDLHVNKLPVAADRAARQRPITRITAERLISAAETVRIEVIGRVHVLQRRPVVLRDHILRVVMREDKPRGGAQNRRRRHLEWESCGAADGLRARRRSDGPAYLPGSALSTRGGQGPAANAERAPFYDGQRRAARPSFPDPDPCLDRSEARGFTARPATRDAQRPFRPLRVLGHGPLQPHVGTAHDAPERPSHGLPRTREARRAHFGPAGQQIGLCRPAGTSRGLADHLRRPGNRRRGGQENADDEHNQQCWDRSVGRHFCSPLSIRARPPALRASAAP